jgi:Na+/H+ antiporter NhaD/arsenite permease-like protein
VIPHREKADVGHEKLWLTAVLFTLTYAALAVGRVPGLRVDRAGIALVGAVLMLVCGLLSLDQAVAADSVDYKTLALLFGMMVVIAFLRLSHFFERLTARALQRIRGPVGLLAATIALYGVLSAFLINDIVCLTLTPLVLHLARKLRCDPVPHLIALATAANIGSTGTITGNPQNIYIGAHRRQPDGARLGGQPDRRGAGAAGGVRVSFWEYCKAGVPLTLLTLAVGVAWLRFVPY